jgi:predicted amidophosphoribosyltransferase
LPSYDLKCQSCGRNWERFSTIAARYDPCESCGGAVTQEFKHSVQATPFSPYFDVALGVHVSSLAERWKHMRNAHVDYRDKLSPGQLSARRDRIEERKKEEARG